MRKALWTFLLSLLLAVLGFWSLKLNVRHIYTGRYDFYEFLSQFGLLAVSLAFLLFIIVSVYLSRKISAITAASIGVAILLIAFVTWELLLPVANVHDWTIGLLGVPLTLFLSGSLFFLVGAIRWVIYRLRRPTATP